MPIVNLVLQAEINGHPFPSSPFLQTMDVDQIQVISVMMPVTLVDVYATIPTVDTFTSLAMLLLQNPDAQVIYRFQGQTDAGLVVPAGGMVLISGAMIDSGAGSNVLCNNSSSNGPATIVGFAAMASS
jgi:hypothetical protein